MAKGAAWKAWWEANKEHYNAKQREYARAKRNRRVVLDPEERARRRREAVARWREENPDAQAASQASINANRSAARAGIEGRVTAAEVLALWQRQSACLECGAGRGVDHVVPLAKGGPNRADNLQNLCRGCNARKENDSRRHRATTGPNAL